MRPTIRFPSMASDVKVDLVAGFLGSGKTTLLKQMAVRQLQNRPTVWLTHAERVNEAVLTRIIQTVSEYSRHCVVIDSNGDIEELYRKSTFHKEVVFYPKTEKNRPNVCSVFENVDL